MLAISLWSCKVAAPQKCLTSHSWEIGEQSSDLSGQVYHYVKGGENTFPYNPSNVLFTFYNNRTGTYIGPDSALHKLKWYFQSSDHIVLTIYSAGNAHGSSNTNHWDLSTITDSSITASGIVNNRAITIKLIPVKK